MKIRKESDPDFDEIRRLNELVFGGPLEGKIVDALRVRCPEALSLDALDGDRIIGHIFFSAVAIEGMTATEAMGLGPMSVHPDFQRKGVGKALVQAGFDSLRKSGCAIVVVLGHPEYYAQFGFVPASRHGLRCQWESVPDDVFMVKSLKPHLARIPQGIVRYQKEFETPIKDDGEQGKGADGC